MALAGTEKSQTWFFFIVSQILVVLALYSLYDEGVVRRPWKKYQEEFNSLQMQQAQKQLAEVKAKMRQEGTDKKLEALQLELEKAQTAREGDEYTKVESEYKKLKIVFGDEELIVKFDKSVLDGLYYQYKHAYQKNHAYKKLEKEYFALDQKVKDGQAALLKRKAELKVLADKLKVFDDKIKDLTAQIETLQAPLVEAQKKIEVVQFRPVEIKQIVVENFGKGGNINWGRTDRCMTCHFASDRPGFEDAPAALGLTVVADEKAVAEAVKKDPSLKGFVIPESKRKYIQTMYGTHPKMQELIGKHPFEQFGCTSCHGGDGRGVNIKGDALGHGDKAHAFHHHAVEPLLRGPQMESNCLACHNGNIQLDQAPNLTKGAELFVELGCQNCHAVTGYDKLFRVGPELNKVGNKVTKEWLVDWIKNPFNYMPNSRMPHFSLKDDEVVSVASYLLANSEKHVLKNKPAQVGNAQNGEKLFSTVGCMACHSPYADEASYAKRATASNLGRIAAKLQNPDWVYDWIKNPKNYSAHTRMPNLRLSNQEAADITAFLTSRNQDYAKVISERSGALAQKVNPEDQVLVSQGKGIINNRGCYSCHLMKGFENGERIGPNLTAEALKEAAVEFDFGDSFKKGFEFTDPFGRKVKVAHLSEYKDGHHTLEEKPGELASQIHERARKVLSEKEGVDLSKYDLVANIDNTWQSWIRNKLKHPMDIFNHQRAQLRMPNFNLSEEEQDALLVYLKGLTARDVPYQFNAALREKHQNIVAGQQLMAEKNCLACHAVGNYGGDINAKIDIYDNAEYGAMTQHYPPELTHVGQKIRPEWLEQYLKDPSMKYRPAVSARMPTFGFDDKQINTLIKAFASWNNRTPELRDTDYSLDPELIAAGKRLSSSEEGLACFACHVMNGQAPAGMPVDSWAPDWVKMRARLQPEFITEWIKNPAGFQKYAIMPGYLQSDAVALPTFFNGHSAEQLEALKAYLLSVGDKRSYKEMKRSYEQSGTVPGVTESAVTESEKETAVQ